MVNRPAESATRRRTAAALILRWAPLSLALLAFGGALAIVAFGQ